MRTCTRQKQAVISGVQYIKDTRQMTILLQLHPQMSYLSRCLKICEDYLGTDRHILCFPFHAPLERLNTHFSQHLESSKILSKWQNEKNYKIEFLNDFKEAKSLYTKRKIKNLNTLEKDCLLTASKDSFFRASIIDNIKSSYHKDFKKAKISEYYKKALFYYELYSQLILSRNASCILLSHGNYSEYISLIIAGLKYNKKVIVVHGGFAPKYEILNIDWRQPSPVSAVKELTRDRSKLFERFSLNYDELIGLNLAKITSFKPSAAFGADAPKNSLVTFLKSQPLVSNYQQNISKPNLKKYFLLCLHCLTDQNHNFETGSSVHESYVEWTKEVIKHIDNNIPLYIKIHPHSDKFGETSAINLLINNCLKENNKEAKIIGPNDGFDIINENCSLPIVITCGGTISLEVATLGMRAISSSESYCPDHLCARIYSNTQFEYILSEAERCISYILNTHSRSDFSSESTRNEASLYKAFLESSHSSRSTNLHLKRMNQFYFFGESRNSSSDEFLRCYDAYANSCKNITLDSESCKLYLETTKLPNSQR